MADSSAVRPGRNEALDYLRVVGLVMMVCAHFWRPLLRLYGAGGVVHAFIETAPFPFFLAFGMTQHRVVRRETASLRGYYILFGLVGLLHAYFMWLQPVWEFLLFLWFWAVLLALAKPLRLQSPQVVALAGLILALNAVLPLATNPFAIAAAEQRGTAPFVLHRWLIPGFFQPLPWGAVVLLGFALGTAFPRWLRRPLPLLCLAVVSAASAYRISTQRSDVPLGFRFDAHKWTATSTYLVLGCALTLILYSVCGLASRLRLLQRYVYPLARFLSDHLLEATVFHYLPVQALLDRRLGLPRAINGMQVGRWWAICLASLTNFILLLAGLGALDAIWRALTRVAGGAMQRAGWVSVALTAFALWGLLELASVTERIDEFSLRWIAFALMVWLSFYLRFVRGLRAPQTETAKTLFVAPSSCDER